MDRRNYYYRKLVDTPEMEDLQNCIENSINQNRLIVGKGIVSGGHFSIDGLSLNLDATVLFDKDGNRIAIPAQNIDLSDYVPASGYTGITIAGRFLRVPADLEVDGHGSEVYFKYNESSELSIQAEYDAPQVYPAITADQVVLLYLMIYPGSTEINASLMNYNGIMRLDSPIMDTLDTYDAVMADHETRLTGHNTALLNHDSRITSNESDIADHENRITTNENYLADFMPVIKEEDLIQSDVTLGGYSFTIRVCPLAYNRVAIFTVYGTNITIQAYSFNGVTLSILGSALNIATNLNTEYGHDGLFDCCYISENNIAVILDDSGSKRFRKLTFNGSTWTNTFLHAMGSAPCCAIAYIGNNQVAILTDDDSEDGIQIWTTSGTRVGTAYYPIANLFDYYPYQPHRIALSGVKNGEFIMMDTKLDEITYLTFNGTEITDSGETLSLSGLGPGNITAFSKHVFAIVDAATNTMRILKYLNAQWSVIKTIDLEDTVESSESVTSPDICVLLGCKAIIIAYSHSSVNQAVTADYYPYVWGVYPPVELLT